MLKISDTMADLYPPDMVTDLFGKDLADVDITERTTMFQELWNSWSDNSYTLENDKFTYNTANTLGPHMKSMFEWQQKRVMVEVSDNHSIELGPITTHWEHDKQIYMTSKFQLRFATPELLAIAKILLS